MMSNLCTPWLCVRIQRCRVVPEIRNGIDGPPDVSATADPEAGSVPAGTASPAGRHAQNNGQRRYVLRASLPLHLHIQVFPAVSFRGFGFGFNMLLKLRWFDLLWTCCGFVVQLLYDKSSTNRTSGV